MAAMGSGYSLNVSQTALSERLYRDQGLDTQKLLGNKSRKMTDKYNDNRGKDWVIVGSKIG